MYRTTHGFHPLYSLASLRDLQDQTSLIKLCRHLTFAWRYTYSTQAGKSLLFLSFPSHENTLAILPSSSPALILFTPVLRHQSYSSSGCMTRKHFLELHCPSVSLNRNLSSPLPKNSHIYLFSKIHSKASKLPSFPSCPLEQSGNPPCSCMWPGIVSPVGQPSSAHLLSWDQVEQAHLIDSPRLLM